MDKGCKSGITHTHARRDKVFDWRHDNMLDFLMCALDTCN